MTYRTAYRCLAPSYPAGRIDAEIDGMTEARAGEPPGRPMVSARAHREIEQHHLGKLALRIHQLGREGSGAAPHGRTASTATSRRKSGWASAATWATPTSGGEGRSASAGAKGA